MKRYFVFILVILMLLQFNACSSQPKNTDVPSTEGALEQNPTSIPTEVPDETESVTIEDLMVEAYSLIQSGDEAGALSLFQQAADMGSSHAKFQLGIYYIRGSASLKPDSKIGKELLIDAIQSDGTVDWIHYTPEALDLLYSVAFDCYGNDDWASAKIMLNYAANAGHCKSQTLLASAFCDGEYERQFQLFQAASEQGYPVATYQLAINYEGGVGVEQDADKANELFQQAANELYQIADTSDDSRVALTVGWCYYYGDAPFSQNYNKAEEYFTKARELGDPLGAYWAADLILDGSVQGNMEDALTNLTFAANAGYPDALYTLGFMLFYGEGVNQDTTKALEYIQMAADRGHPYAKYYLETGIMIID